MRYRKPPSPAAVVLCGVPRHTAQHPGSRRATAEVHLHFHGASAEDVAAIVTRVNRDRDQDVTQ